MGYIGKVPMCCHFLIVKIFLPKILKRGNLKLSQNTQKYTIIKIMQVSKFNKIQV